MIERILGIILPVFLVILVGYFYARRVKPDMAMVNRISMTILAPALIFSALASKDFDVDANWLLMLASVGVVLDPACSPGHSPGCCMSTTGRSFHR